MTVRRFIAVAALVFFTLPIGLRVAGVTARPFENRPMAPRPELSAGWDVFDQTTRFFVDRMPLREQAVRAHSWTSREVLGTSPTWRQDLLAGEGSGTAALPQEAREAAGEGARPKDTRQDEQQAGAPGAGAGPVLEGPDGWLFLTADLQRACSPQLPWSQVAANLQSVTATIAALGKDVVLMVPPDKTTAYAELVEGPSDLIGCATRNRRELWALLEQADNPTLLPLRTTIAAARRATPEPLYKRKDAHWNTVGASYALEPLLGRLSSRVRVRPNELVAAPDERYQGDLTILRGAPEDDTTPARVVKRAPGAPVLRGRTLFIGDSFGNYQLEQLRAYAPDLQVLPWPSTDPAALAAAVRDARRVIIEVVERELTMVTPDGGPLVAMAAALR